MSLAWVPFIMVTIFLFGIGQVFTKTGTARLGSPGMLLLLSFNMFIIYGGAWLIFHEDVFIPFTALLYCILAATLSAVGYIFFYEAVERQKISLVGVITAAYPFITVIMAVLFLHEPLTLTQILGIILIITSVSFLAYSPHEYDIQKKTWLLFAVLCFITWGIWAATAKFAINLTGHITYTGVYALVGPLIWIPYWYVRSGKFNIIKKDTHAELSLAFFCFGGLTFYAALHYGLASMVTAFSNLYPFVTLVFARLILSETMERHHKIAVAVALLGILIVTV